jgi:hypothetical protein
MAIGIVMAVVAVTVVLVLLTRMQNKNKTAAVADLASDREASKPPDIFELVNQEVQEAGIGSLPGADGVDPTVLLRVWKRDGTGCAGEQGTFVLYEGLAPDEASEDTLRFECGGNPKSESDLQAADPSGATE